MQKVIAIAGAPNVGKSTLFNRIIGKRKALVDDMPGLTRDRLYGIADWSGHSFILIDTGGLLARSKTTLDDCIKKQTLSAVKEADAVICLFDGHGGPTHSDKYIVELLRKAGKPVIYCVNKVGDGPLSEGGLSPLAQFYELGIKDELIAISAEHGRGVGELLDKISSLPLCKGESEGVETHSTSPDPSLRRRGDAVLQIALIGRPNAGKSSLINKLAGAERVIAHELPGTTRDTVDVDIEYKGEHFTFVDTAGLKRKGKTIHSIDKLSSIMSLKAISRSDIVALLIDVTEGVTHHDSFLIDHIWHEGKGLMILMNKWDTVPPAKRKEYEEFFDEKILKLHKLPILYISAKSGENNAKIFETALCLRQALQKRFKTSELNSLLEEIKSAHHLPLWKKKHETKIYYATQTGTNPPELVMFANYPEGIQESYKRYIINKLQDEIGYGVPIRIKFKKKS